MNRAKEGRINGPKLTLVVGTLGTTVEVLASVLGNPDVVSSLVVEVLDVLLESVNGNVVPMERQEADISTSSGKEKEWTNSFLQSAAEFPHSTQILSKSRTHWRPDGAEVVAAPPSRIPFCLTGK